MICISLMAKNFEHFLKVFIGLCISLFRMLFSYVVHVLIGCLIVFVYCRHTSVGGIAGSDSQCGVLQKTVFLAVWKLFFNSMRSRLSVCWPYFPDD